MNDTQKAVLPLRPSAAEIGSFLKALWEDALHVPEVKPDDDFFAVGGDSALVIEMLVAVSARYDREFNYNAFFPKPTIRTLGTLIEDELGAHHDQPRG
jgi:acyl carrier protein